MIEIAGHPAHILLTGLAAVGRLAEAGGYASDQSVITGRSVAVSVWAA